MCFSTAASFGSGIVLTTIGIASINKTSNPNEYLFASIPLLFGLQQFAEGFLWFLLSHNGSDIQIKMAVLFYLTFAQMVWPIWIPLSVMLIEKHILLSAILLGFLIMGIIVSSVLTYYLITYEVEAKIVAHHISYLQHYPNTYLAVGELLYLFATILPPLFTRFKSMWLLGTAILLSYIISVVYYQAYFISVWCFFAACISIIVYIVIIEIKNTGVVTKYL